MTLEELEQYFYWAIVDDYQQSWDGLRRQSVRSSGRKPSVKRESLTIWERPMTSSCS